MFILEEVMRRANKTLSVVVEGLKKYSLFAKGLSDETSN
jgi:hypothetical protein